MFFLLPWMIFFWRKCYGDLNKRGITKCLSFVRRSIQKTKEVPDSLRLTIFSRKNDKKGYNEILPSPGYKGLKKRHYWDTNCTPIWYLDRLLITFLYWMQPRPWLASILSARAGRAAEIGFNSIRPCSRNGVQFHPPVQPQLVSIPSARAAPIGFNSIRPCSRNWFQFHSPVKPQLVCFLKIY